MGQKVKFQGSHSRNSNDWTYTKTTDGRYAFVAKEKGVKQRIGLVTTWLAKHPSSTKEEIVDALKGVHPSYNANDLSAPFKHMRKLGMLKVNGRCRGATYQLTPNAKRILAGLDISWV